MQLLTIVRAAASLALLSLPTTIQAQGSDSVKFVWTLLWAQDHKLIRMPA